MNLAAKILKAYDDGSLGEFTNSELKKAIIDLEYITDFLSSYGDKLIVYAIANKTSAIRSCLNSREMNEKYSVR